MPRAPTAALLLALGAACLPPTPPGALSPTAQIAEAARSADLSRLAAARERFRRAPSGERLYLLWGRPARRWGVRTEWVWVRVVTWDDDGAMGLLVSRPLRLPGLHAGDPVTVPAGEIGDYAVVREGHVVEGAAMRRFLAGGGAS